MKRRLCLSIMAAIILSLVIPICGAPPANAAISKPSRAYVPDLVQLRPWDDTIYFDEISLPQNAKSLQFYLRTTGKYVKTVKKNTKAYKKYKKNQKKYIVVKNKKAKNRYMVYKAGKWKLIWTEKDLDYNLGTERYVIAKYKLKNSRVYQLRVRGKNYSRVGKYSKILQFKTPSKKVREDYIYDYELQEVLRGEILGDLEIDVHATEKDIEYAREKYELVSVDYAYTVYVSKDVLDSIDPNSSYPQPSFIPKNPNGRIL